MKTYYTVDNLTVGDVLTETWVDEVKGNLDNLIVRPAARVYSGTAVAIPHNSLTAVVFTSERFDTDSMHDTGSNTTRITAQTTGIYSVGGHVTW